MPPAGDPKDDPATGPWHVDKRIPVALIITMIVGLIGQSVVVGVWAGTVQQRLEGLEASADRDHDLANDMAVVREQITQINKTLDRIVNRWDTERTQ